MIRCRLLRNRGRKSWSRRRRSRICRRRSNKWAGKSHKRRRRRDCKRFRLRSYANNWRNTIKLGKITNKLRICRSRLRKWRTKMNSSMSLSRVLNFRTQPRQRSMAMQISLSNSRMIPICLKSMRNTPKVCLIRITAGQKLSQVSPPRAYCYITPLNLISWGSPL
jgi:hypothetical protein